MGPLASVKTTLAKTLASRWQELGMQTKCFEERYIENPYLDDFYDNPEEFSFKSQVYFLASAIEQKKDLSSSLIKNANISDPDLEMHKTYASVHHEMGWMNNDQYYKVYLPLYEALAESDSASDTHIYVMVNAPVEVL